MSFMNRDDTYDIHQLQVIQDWLVDDMKLKLGSIKHYDDSDDDKKTAEIAGLLTTITLLGEAISYINLLQLRSGISQFYKDVVSGKFNRIENSEAVRKQIEGELMSRLARKQIN